MLSFLRELRIHLLFQDIKSNKGIKFKIFETIIFIHFLIKNNFRKNTNFNLIYTK